MPSTRPCFSDVSFHNILKFLHHPSLIKPTWSSFMHFLPNHKSNLTETATGSAAAAQMASDSVSPWSKNIGNRVRARADVTAPKEKQQMLVGATAASRIRGAISQQSTMNACALFELNDNCYCLQSLVSFLSILLSSEQVILSAQVMSFWFHSGNHRWFCLTILHTINIAVNLA